MGDWKELMKCQEAASAEAITDLLLVALQEENYRLRIRALQGMRHGNLRRLTREALQAWREDVRLRRLRSQVLQHAAEFAFCIRPRSTPHSMMKAVFTSWLKLASGVQILRCMQQELESHRQAHVQSSSQAKPEPEAKFPSSSGQSSEQPARWCPCG
eukprot:s111_g17.t1